MAASKKIEKIWVAEDQIGGELVLVTERVEFASGQFLRLARQRRAFVEHGTDLFLEGAGAPAFNPAHLGVEVALKGILKVDDREEMGPAQLSHQC